jgi:hypothetical protein
MRKYFLIPMTAVLHLGLSGALLLSNAGSSLGRLESGEAPGGLRQFAAAVGQLLLYPLFIPASAIFRSSGLVSWLLLIGNSLIWAVLICFLVRLAVRRAVRHRAGSIPNQSVQRLRT